MRSQKGRSPMQSNALYQQRQIIDTRRTALHPDDRYGEPTPGLSWLPLDFDETRGEGLYLVRFAAGASSLPHEHVFGEAFIVLEGVLIDSDGQQLRAGEFVRYAPGSRHFSTSPEGCLLGVFLRGRNRRLVDGEL
jgi:quercetin dioxygenase-like cupin family protein